MVFYAVTIFLSAFLLFQLQPMIAKMVLPWFGGSAAVWITAMFFFQTALLGGYLYAHWLIRRMKPAAQGMIHTALLALSLLYLPVAPTVSWKPSGNEDPLLHMLGLLVFSVGLPYVLLSSTSPLLQAWYSRRRGGALPYRLFALSNLASLLGLVAYPFLVEPRAILQEQAFAWSAGYAAFVLLTGAAALRNRDKSPSPVTEEAAAIPAEEIPGAREHVIWFLLSGCASILLLAVSNHLLQNVAAIPFLWVLPLALYLLSFILTFDFERFYKPRIVVWLLMAALGLMAYSLEESNADIAPSLRTVIPVFTGGLFICCLYCHGELVRRKPRARHLTSFYLTLSLGGAFGGVLVGLIAPYAFRGYFELPIALALCALLMVFLLDRRNRTAIAGAWTTAVFVVVAGGSYVSAYTASVRTMDRNFYGDLRVSEYAQGADNEYRVLFHGVVEHGLQFTAPARRTEHTAYYSASSGVGLAIEALRSSAVKVGVIGLGTGSIASFAKTGDLYRFYEINPLVEKIARSEFTYLNDCRGRTEVVIGDGRLSLEREGPQNYDVLAVDAFSGDAIPVHLLTKEAFKIYFRHIRPGGILALHISNSHLDLAPLVSAITADLGANTVLIVNPRNDDKKIYPAWWALVSQGPLMVPGILEYSRQMPSKSGFRVWTDAYSNLFAVLDD